MLHLFAVIWYFNKLITEWVKHVINRPWWLSGLSRHSNSSRVVAEDPGLNPAWGIYLYG